MNYNIISFIAALLFMHIHAGNIHQDYIDGDIFIPAEYLIAREHELDHNYAEAEKYYLEAAARGDVWSYYSLGLMFERLELLDKAEQYYLIPANAGKQQAAFALGRVYVKQNKHDLAMQYLTPEQDKNQTQKVDIIH